MSALGTADDSAVEPAPPPPEPPRPESAGGRRLRWASVIWLALLGTTAVIVGGHDTAVGREITVRLSGTAVLGAGVVLLAGALGLRRGTPQGEALASLAALLGAALGLLTFLTQAVNDDPDNRLFIWGAIVALSLGAWAYIRSQLTPEERQRGMFARLPVLKSALSLGLLFSVAQFWYSSIYLPTTAPMTVIVDTTLERPERHGDRFVVRGTVTVDNPSSTRVFVLGSSFAISRYRVRRNAVPDERFARDVRNADVEEIDEARRHRIRWPPDEVSRGRFVPDSVFFEPKEKVKRPFIAWFSAGDFDAVRLDFQLVIARPTVGEDYDEEDVDTKRDEEQGLTVITRPVPADGWLQSLTRGDRFVVATYYDDAWHPETREFAPVFVDFGRTRSPDVDIDFSDRMQDFYGVGVIDGTAAVPLP